MDASEQKPTNYTTVLSCASYSGQRGRHTSHLETPRAQRRLSGSFLLPLQAVLQQGHQSAALRQHGTHTSYRKTHTVCLAHLVRSAGGCYWCAERRGITLRWQVTDFRTRPPGTHLTSKQGGKAHSSLVLQRSTTRNRLNKRKTRLSTTIPRH